MHDIITPTLAAFLLAPLWATLIWLCARSIHHDLTRPRPVSRDWRIVP